MKDKPVPKYKMTDALSDIPETDEYPQVGAPPQEQPHPAEVKQHNAQVHQDRKERLVEIGRGEQGAGRGGA